MKRSTRISAMALLALACATSPAQADERESLETLRDTTLGLIKALVSQGVLTQEKADEIVRQATAAHKNDATSAAAASTPNETGAAVAKPGTVRVPYVPEFVRREIRDQLKTEILAQAKEERWAMPGLFPEWLDRIKFSGEMTLRGEQDVFRPPCGINPGVGAACNTDAQSFNSAEGTNLNNTTQNRERLRLRAILGADIKVNAKTDAQIRITTGSTTNPVTNFQTLGSGSAPFTLALDRGFLQYRPLESLEFTGGRQSVPFLSTDLLYYDRLSVDGVTAKYLSHLTSRLDAFGTLGAYAIQDIEPSLTVGTKSKWLYGFQLGSALHFEDKSSIKAGLAYYDFTHVEGFPNAQVGDTRYNLAVPLYPQKGNSLFNINPVGSTAALFGLAAKFRELDLTAVADYARYAPIHLTGTVDVVKNIGYDSNEINNRAGFALTEAQLSSSGSLVPLRERNRGYFVKFNAGYPVVKERGDWQAWVGYKYLQRDAVLDAYTDPDFHLGGTNAKGYLAGASVGIDHDLWFTLKYFSADAIDGPPLTIDVLEADLNIRF